MRITSLIPGTGSFYCGSCLRDNALARALRHLGHDVQIVPLYLPFFLEEPTGEADLPVHMGGINMYLQQKLPPLGNLPQWMTRPLDAPGLLRWASTKGDMTSAEGLEDMILSMIRGEEGRQRHEVEHLVEWLQGEQRPDVICLSNVMLSGLARSLKSELGVPVVASLQGEAPFLDTLREPFRARVWSELAARARDVDAFIPVSRWYGDLMGERLGLDPERVHVVYNGIELDGLISEGDRTTPEAPTIGYLARMCEDKGLPTLVEAFRILAGRDRVPARLAVAGVVLPRDRALVRRLQGELREAGLAERVEFHPNVPREDKLAFLRGLSVLSVPATYGESFGLYLLEAMAAGVPVVQPRHAAFPEILEATGGGVLCEPDDPQALALALEELLLDPARAAALARRGREAVRERFSVESMGLGVQEVCSRVASR